MDPRSNDPDRGSSESEIDDLVADYVDRLNDGKPLDAEEVLARYPAFGEELLQRLGAFVKIEPPSRIRESLGALGTLGDYTLRRQIGRGGMGVVYEAWEHSMDRPVAVKVLPGAAAADDKTFNRFMREARTAGRLSHPNVVPVFATGLKENTAYYAMELVDGETLAQILARLRAAASTPEEREEALATISGRFRKGEEIETARPETPSTAAASARRGVRETDDVELGYYVTIAKAFAGVAEGLHHAHTKGIIHRDIKPSNLILDREGRLRILDFGLARLEGQESLTLSGDVVGTPLYMSPEQARARRIPIDHRTDVYSLGATMYEMLTWQPPFKGKDHRDTLSQILSADPQPVRRRNPTVPRDLETIVLACLRKDASDRYATAEALAKDLMRFARGEPIEARPQTRWEKAVWRMRRNRRQIVTGTVILALSLVVAALVYDRYAEPSAEVSGRAGQLPGRFEDVVPVEELNSPHSDMNPVVSFDGLELFFGSRRPEAGKGNYDIWVARRSTPSGAWGDPANVAEINTPIEEIPCWLSLDGLRLYYEVKGSAPDDTKDLRFATRRERVPNARWEPGPPEELALFNTPQHDESASLTADECEIYFSSERPGAAGWKDIWYATRPSRESPWRDPRPLEEVNTFESENQSCISPDGLTLWWGKRNKGEIWYAMRQEREARFGPPRLVKPRVNSPGWENAFRVSTNWPASGVEAYFMRMRGGKGAAACDIFKATWHAAPGPSSDPRSDETTSEDDTGGE